MKKLLLNAVALIVFTGFVSCENEEANDSLAQSASFKRSSISLSHSSAKFRKYPPGADGCINEQENCHPEDIVITRPAQLMALNMAMMSGSGAVAEYFATGDNAVSLIPEWNEGFFVPVKEAILSREYNFAKETKETNEIYFLGRDRVVSSDDYEYVFVFENVE